MPYKGYHLTKPFLAIKSQLAKYSRWLETSQDLAEVYSLSWPDGSLFATVQLRTDSVAVFINIEDIDLATFGLVGFVDSRGWIHFRINRDAYPIKMQHLFRYAFITKAPDYNLADILLPEAFEQQ